ncbi:hypothetical protein [Ramlibacter alkalitolerans]|uniref:Uncharacterized protein n=1 Tax=Ramlibacter alkalitolerans TaxID=2039631 RepID=A0ABS1JT91_9BURK|nr:hypothetical protein [Ramlibacter alkalitolerans]MBL0427437.1 hypothetical protein [Ramlibacter alkalitolerans]
MVMFKTKFQPRVASDKPQAQQQQQRQPVPPMPKPQQQDRKAPPIEKERGPQYPVKEPGPGHAPERVR